MASSFLFGLAALGVDVARWWLEAQRVQAAADAAALGSVSFVPMDIDRATTSAKEITDRNGYTDGVDGASVKVSPGARASQLRVTVCGRTQNGFGGILGVSSTTICRTALADYTGPAPMGSPCNTFGNEPNSGNPAVLPTDSSAAGKSPYTNCLSKPQLWAVIQGPSVPKENGDRFQTRTCSANVDGCAGSTNSEYYGQGYFFLVRVLADGVGKKVDLQLYDPEFASTGTDCSSLPKAGSWSKQNPNPYVNDATTRYAPNGTSAGTTGAPYCNGDGFAGASGTVMTTSFALRKPNDTLDPTTAEVQSDSRDGQPCIAQYRGQSSAPTVDDLSSGTKSYDDSLSQTFHNWTSFCQFTPTRTGDYYLQVRSNISFAGTAQGNNSQTSVISRGNTEVVKDPDGNTTVGYGSNKFAIRAYMPAGSEKGVAVSGYDRMPIFANADTASPKFNLIRVLPAGASKSIAFTFFDIGDSESGGANVTVIPPADATNTVNGKTVTLNSQSNAVKFPNGCRAIGGYADDGDVYDDCKAPITGSKNDGRLETLTIPIPDGYSCTYTSQGGCWYQVQVTFGSGSVHDTTTWTANITGDPVRLIE